MRLLALFLPLLCAGLASAYGPRAAAERALYFLLYELEDMLAVEGVAKGDDFQVAPGCADGRKVEDLRTGLLGKSRRCTLPQFLDYTWRATKTEVEGVEYWDEKPDADTVRWQGGADVLKGSDLSAVQIINFIQSAKDKDGNKLTRSVEKPLPGGKTVKVSYKGYTGNVDEPGKLWPKAGLPTGIDGYFRSLEMAGPRAQKLGEIWNAAWKDGTLKIKDEYKTHPDHKAHLAADKAVLKYFDEIKMAADKIYYLRVSDLHKFQKNNGKWKDAFGVEPVWDKRGPDDPAKHKEIVPWFVMNKAETIKKIKDAKGLADLAEAEKIYNEKWDQIRGSDGFKGHQSAIDKADFLRTEVAKIDLVSCR